MVARLRPSLAVLLLLVPACGGGLTSSEWVAEPEASAVDGDARSAFAEGALQPTAVSDSAPSSGPQRLDHTVTLGEVVEAPGTPRTPGAAAPPPTSITINIASYGAPATYGYGYAAPVGGGFASSGARGAVSAPRSSGGGGIVPGQSWPAPVSAGPSFPFSTSPASPWETRR
jgi:hypothetical protein